MGTATLTPATPGVAVDPTRDGRPLGETDKHRELMAYLIAALKSHFSGQPDVYLSGNSFVFGAEMRLRDSYMAWKEDGLLPDVVFEVTSRATQREDLETKMPRLWNWARCCLLGHTTVPAVSHDANGVSND